MPKLKKERAPAPAADVEWFRERARLAGFTSLAELSLKVCGHKDLIARSLGDGRNTPRDLRPAEITEMAQALRVPVVYLFHKLGYKAPFARCKVAGTVNAKGAVEFLSSTDLSRHVAAPSEIEIDLSALVVSDDAGLPWAGAAIYYEPPTRVEVGAFGRLSIAETASGVVFAGIVRRGDDGPAGALVEPIGAKAKPFAAELKSAAPVLWLHFG